MKLNEIIMEFKNLILEIRTDYALIKINRPDALNALSTALYADINGALDEVEKNEQLRCLIITGEGKAFVAGADILEMSEMGYDAAKEYSLIGHNTFNRIANFRIPVIAAVNGFALGGGCEFAMSCDIRIANNFAKFGQPEVNLGLIPGYCGTQRLSRLVGLSNALHLLMTADMIDAQEAYRIGLVQKVVPAEDLLAESEKMAVRIASKGKLAVEKVKEVTVKGFTMNFDEAASLEVEEFAKLFGKPESKEGMMAFLEKRKPNW